MIAERIYMLGFMGSGKSTVGRELALKLHWPFFDLDAEIEKGEGLAVKQIFEQQGEPRFRELERSYLQSLSARGKSVVALGGGAYLDATNRALVESTGVSVWLDGSFSTFRQRVRPDGSRPLWADPVKARQLYEERRVTYQLARIHILTDNRLPDELADEIVRKVTAL